MTPTHDWRPSIVRLVELKQAIDDADKEGLWEYHLPAVAATEEQLLATEKLLRVRLDEGYRDFLAYADGWRSLLQSIDLFGTADLVGRRSETARQKLAEVDAEVLSRGGFSPSELLPIASTEEDLDLFVTPVRGGRQSPQVIWIAGGEIDRFPSFAEFMQTMVAYNERELAALRGEK